MAKASDNVFPKVILGMQPTAPAAPADSSWKVYSAADGIYARSSNTTVALGGAAVSAGSNATRVSETAGAGVGPTYSYSDHRHDGIGQITSSSSNTLQRGTINLRAGANVGISASDTDGDGEFDTVTISATGGGVGSVSKFYVSAATAARTAGNVTLSGSSYADVDTGIDLTVAASSGDVLLVNVSGFWQNEATFSNLDAATIVSASPVNYISGNGSGGTGVSSWKGISGQYTVAGGAVYYVVQSGDISGGNVVLRLRGHTSGGGNKVLRATSGEALRWWAVNLGH